MPEPRFNVRAFLDPRDDEGHLIARRVSEKKVAELAAKSVASVGDDYFPIEVTEAMIPRFRIKRHSVHEPEPVARPWVMRDAACPAFVGAYTTLDAAVAAIDTKLSEETGIPTRRSIRKAMSR